MIYLQSQIQEHMHRVYLESLESQHSQSSEDQTETLSCHHIWQVV